MNPAKELLFDIKVVKMLKVIKNIIKKQNKEKNNKHVKREKKMYVEDFWGNLSGSFSCWVSSSLHLLVTCLFWNYLVFLSKQ